MTVEIVQIVQELSTVGGVETVASELVRAFSRAKIVNTVIASAVDYRIVAGTTVEPVAVTASEPAPVALHADQVEPPLVEVREW